MAAPFYSQGDQDIYASGNKFIPQEQYRLGPYTPPEIMGQNTNAGIVNTQAAGSYMGYPSYEAWLLAQGGGGGGNGGGQDEIEEDTFSMGMSPGAMGGKLPGFGNWAKRTLGSLGHAYSQLPTPTNLLFKGIRRWKENREIKRAEQAAIEQAKIDKVSQQSQANAIAAGGGQPQSGITASTTAAQAAGMGGGSRQATSAGSTNSGRDDGGWGWAQGGRIGYERGRVVNPGGYQGDIEIPEGFLEGLPNEDYQKIIEEYMKQKKHEELMRELGPFQWAADGGIARLL